MTIVEDSVPEYLYAYCERAGDPALWAEPLNAITNLAFVYFAYKAWVLWRGIDHTSFRRIGDIWVLTIAIFAIGIGSGLWHTHAAPGWTVIADVIPIYIFINVAVVSIFMRLFAFSLWQSLGLWAIFQMCNVSAEILIPRELLNGSMMYLPTWAMLGLVTFWLKQREQTAWEQLWFVLQVFTASLLFRTMDIEVCDWNPFGTHFLWHMLNAVVLYQIVKILLQSRKTNA